MDEKTNPIQLDYEITKGKCNCCKIVWYWKAGTRKLKDTRCPVCRCWLYQTTKLMRRFDWRPYPKYEKARARA